MVTATVPPVGSDGLPELSVDLCAIYAPLVYGGRVDPWTWVEPGSWQGDEWPCPGRTVASEVLHAVCSCHCHIPGGRQHKLPARRTGFHPTEPTEG